MKTKSPIKRWVEYLSRHFPKIYRWWISKWKDVKHCSLLEKWKSKLQWAITFHQPESTNNKSWRECGEKGTLLHCWWKRKLIQPIWGTVVGRGCFLWPVYSLGKTVSLCPASFCTPKPNSPVTPGILNSYLCIPVSCDEKNIFFFC